MSTVSAKLDKLDHAIFGLVGDKVEERAEKDAAEAHAEVKQVDPDSGFNIVDGKRTDHMMTEKEKEKDLKDRLRQEKKVEGIGAQIHKDQEEGTLKPFHALRKGD